MVRDWRWRIFAPVILIHVLVFAGLYALLYRLVVGEIVEAYKHGAELLLRDVARGVEEAMFRQHPVDFQGRIQTSARSHGVDLKLFSAKKLLVADSGGESPADVMDEIDTSMSLPGPKTAWFVKSHLGFRLNGVHVIANDQRCHGCHGAENPVRGVLHMSIDLSSVMEATRRRLLLRIGVLLMAWVGLALVMVRIRNAVIGRPIERIENVLRSISLQGKSKSGTGDLENLAARLNRAILSLVGEQKRREASFQRHFARAEQMVALGELAAGLSHEIRNPLAGVSSALQLLRSEEADPGSDRSRLLDQMLGELNRASASLDGLLRLARPEPPVKTTVDLALLARDVVRLFEPQLRGRRVSLTVEASSRLPALQLDRGQMTQLLLNLLTNSAQAVKEGGSIRVNLAPFLDGNGVILSVIDDGAGIPADQIEKVWEPFFTTKAEGTGLGLPISRQIAELHGGTITVESAPGEGTRVLVLLPTEPSEVSPGHVADPHR